MMASNATRSFLGPEYLWPGLSIELDEIRPGRGGRRLFVYGSGHAVVQRVSPDEHEVRVEFRLSPAEARHLQQLIVENDLITIKHTWQPGEDRLTLSLANADLRYEIISKPVRVADARFDAVYAELTRLADQAQPMKPTYTGRRVYRYQPSQGLAGWRWRWRRQVEDLRYLEPRDLGRLVLEIAAAIYHLRYVLLIVIALFIIAYAWVVIDPAVTYGLDAAIVHGFFWVQNGLISLVTQRYYWAPKNVGLWYSVGYFIGATVIPFLINLGLQAALAILKRD